MLTTTLPWSRVFANRRAGDLYGGGNILLKARNLVKGLQVRFLRVWSHVPDL